MYQNFRLSAVPVLRYTEEMKQLSLAFPFGQVILTFSNNLQSLMFFPRCRTWLKS